MNTLTSRRYRACSLPNSWSSHFFLNPALGEAASERQAGRKSAAQLSDGDGRTEHGQQQAGVDRMAHQGVGAGADQAMIPCDGYGSAARGREDSGHEAQPGAAVISGQRGRVKDVFALADTVH